MKRLIIIDGNAIIHRAYHALPPMTTRTGEMVNAVYGFTSMLLKAWHDLKPDYIVATFDMSGPTFRHEKFEKYKATRVKADQELYDQIPIVHEIVHAFNIPIFEKSGYEADDVIGTIVKKNKKNSDLEILIVTGDKDTIQLIDKNVKVFTLRKGMSDTVLYDEAEAKKVFGFPARQMIDYKALRGDASDNIPGVTGIGEKTALELLQKFGTLDELYKQLKKKGIEKQIKPGVLKKLVDGEKDALMSYELATIDENVPDIKFNLPDCLAKDFDRAKIMELLQRLEFLSLVRRLPGEKSEAVKPKKETAKKTKMEFVELKNTEALESFLALIRVEGRFAVKALLSGDDVFSSSIIGLAVAAGASAGFVKVNFLKQFSEIFAEENIELVAHDVKRLIKIFRLQNIEIKNSFFDLMLASYILNPGTRAHDENSVALKFAGVELKSANGQNSLFGVDERQAAEDIFILSQTQSQLCKELVAANNLDLLQKIEIPVAKILAQMELHGIKIDLAELKKLSDHLAAEVKQITAKIYEYAGTEFNIGSPNQLREILFEKMDIPALGIKKGKTGLSTAQAELEKMRGLHPIIDEIEKWRELTKLQNTYVDVLPKLVNPKTGRVHTTYNQAITATGRLSSSDPNLQNIPIRGELGNEIRKCFIAESGHKLISADYSQIELRIVASLAEDKKMIEIFEKGEDIHRATAAVINGVPLDKVTKEMRNNAKQVNFGVLYGMGSYGLSSRVDLTQYEAKQFIDKYFSEFSGVKKYLDTTLDFARQSGYVETLFGRRRYIPEINASNFQVKSGAERMAINHPVQGTAADLMKMAMIEIDQKLRDKKYKSDDIKILLQVHDELIFEVKENLVDEVSKVIKDAMENVLKLRVPVVAEVHAADNWGEVK